MKTVIFLGRQGSGKSTQAELFRQDHNGIIVSTGILLRARALIDDTVKEIMATGGLVPPELISELLNTRFKEIKPDDVLVLDGTPREEHDIAVVENALSSIGRKLDKVFLLDLPQDLAHQRLVQRQSGRSDANAQALAGFDKTFLENIGAIKAHFERKGVFHLIDASQPAATVQRDIAMQDI